MFLWCGCHCADESQSAPPNPGSESVSFLSESIVSESVAGSVQPPPQPPRIGCDVCTFGVAPAVYEFEWNYQGKAVKAFPPRPCCSAYTTQKKYRLIAREAVSSPPISARCSWSSNEPIKMRNPIGPFGVTATCTDSGIGRVQLTLTKVFQRVTALVLIRYKDNTPAGSVTQAPISEVLYHLVDANGNRIVNETGSMLCLQQMRFRASWALENRPPVWTGSFTLGGVPYGSPCDQDSFSMIDSGLPEYVTCTPAAA